MKFGAVTHAVGHDLPFEQTLRIIKDLGFDSALLLTKRSGKTVSADGACNEAFPDLLTSDPEHVRRALDNAGLEAASVHFSGSIDLTTDEGAEQAAGDMKAYAELNLAIGCPRLTHPVPTCGRTQVPTEEKAVEIKRLAYCMNAVVDAFVDRGLKVACDIHYRSWVEGLDDCRLLLDSMPNPNAGILLNIGHMTTCQSYGWLLVDEYPDRIPVVGWKDHSLAADRPKPMWSVELGTADSPFELYARRFKAHDTAQSGDGPQGTGTRGDRIHLVNCENVADEARVAALGRSLAYMRKLWDSV